jgi:hypothetical protein
VSAAAVVSTAAAVVSTAAAVVSTAAAGESVVAGVSEPLLQAAIKPATAIIAKNFFIFFDFGLLFNGAKVSVL